MTREQQAEYLKGMIVEIQGDKNSANPIKTVHTEKSLFIEMAYCFIHKHGK